MSAFDPVNHYDPRYENTDYIVPERIREACDIRGISYECAACKCEIGKAEFGLMANGHKEVPREMIFRLMETFNLPEKFFYRIQWERT